MIVLCPERSWLYLLDMDAVFLHPKEKSLPNLSVVSIFQKGEVKLCNKPFQLKIEQV
jgi:hypothetical protein